MDKIGKLPKGNRIFTKDPKILKFIEYMKKEYTSDIRSINLGLYDEEDAEYNEWQVTVSECSDNHKEGYVWAAWHIPTSCATVDVSAFIAHKNIDSSRYSVVVPAPPAANAGRKIKEGAEPPKPPKPKT